MSIHGSAVYFSISSPMHFLLVDCGIIIVTARKRSLGQGNIFSSVCQEFCSPGGGFCLSACWDTTPSPRSRHPPWDQAPPRAQCMLGDTVGRYASYSNAILFHNILWQNSVFFQRLSNFLPILSEAFVSLSFNVVLRVSFIKFFKTFLSAVINF